MILHRLEGIDQADGPELGPVSGLGALLGGVLQPELDRVHADLHGQLVDDGLDAKRRDGRRRGAIGGELGPVDDDVVARRLDVVDFVAGKGAHHRQLDQRAGKGAALEPDVGLAGRDPARLGDPDLDPQAGAGRRPRRPKNLLAGHHELHRAARLARERERHRLDEDGGLAAEAAADLGSRDAELRDVHAQEPGAHIAHAEVALRADPKLALAVAADAGQTSVRLDVALVGRPAPIMLLDDLIGLRKSLLDVADIEIVALRDVGRAVGLEADLGREHRIQRVQLLVQDRGIGMHRRIDVGDVRQDLVVDLDQAQRATGDGGADGGDGGDRVTVVERLLARHDVVADVKKIVVAIVEIIARDDGLHARQGGGLRGVDGADPRMSVGAAQDPADQHAGRTHIGAEARAPGYLVEAVGPHRTGADDGESLPIPVGFLVKRHVSPPSARPRRPAPRARSCHSRYSDKGCRPTSSGPRPR